MNNMISIVYKVIVTLMVTLIVACMLTACGGADAENPSDSVNISDIVFEDQNLKLCIDETGAQTVADLSVLACAQTIESLVGLEQLSHLQRLELAVNKVTTLDFSSLAELQELYLIGRSYMSITLPETGRLKCFGLRGGIIETLNIDQHTQLEEIHLSAGVSAAQIGDFSQFSRLKKLYIDRAFNSDFILPIDSSLEYLYYATSSSKNLDLSNQSQLKELVLYDTNIADRLDISNNKKLEAFTYYTSGSLVGINDDLTKIDLSQNVELIYLDLSYSKIETLDLSNNTKLQSVNLSGANVSALDISFLNELTDLNLYGNELASFEGTPSLVNLQLQSNQIETIDLSASKNLQSLNASYNKLSYLDVSANNKLTTVQLNNNELSDFSTSGLEAVEELYLGSNQLSVLDLNGLAKLKVLDLQYNNFHSLAIPGYVQLFDLNMDHNPGVCSFIPSGLHEVLGDRVFACDYSELGDGAAEESEKTMLDLMAIEDEKLRACVSASGISFAEDIHELSCKDIKSLNGVDQLSGLVSLKLYSSELELDLSALPNLKVLKLELGEILSLNLSQNSELEYVTIFYTSGVSDFDFSGQEKLVSLSLSPLALSELSLDSSELVSLELFGYQSFDFDLENLDLSALPNLKYLSINSYGNQDFEFDFSAVADLEYLSLSRINIPPLSIKQLPLLKGLALYDISINELDLSHNPGLESLVLNGVNLQSLDLSAVTNLRKLSLRSNNLVSIDTTMLSELTYLNAVDNKLESIDLSLNNKLSLAELDSNFISQARFPMSARLQVQMRGPGLLPSEWIALIESGYEESGRIFNAQFRS